MACLVAEINPKDPPECYLEIAYIVLVHHFKLALQASALHLQIKQAVMGARLQINEVRGSPLERVIKGQVFPLSQ